MIVIKNLYLILLAMLFIFLGFTFYFLIEMNLFTVLIVMMSGHISFNCISLFIYKVRGNDNEKNN